MPSVNLAPGTQQIVAARRRRRRLFSLSALVLLAIGIAWGGLLWYEQKLQNDLTATQDRLRTVQAEIARLSTNAERVQLFEDRLAAIGGLLDQHVSWESVMQSLERLLPPTTTLRSLAVRADQGELVLQGVTTDVDQVAQALASLLSDKTQTIFEDGTLSSVQREEIASPEEGVPAQVNYVFQVALTFSPGVLNQK